MCPGHKDFLLFGHENDMQIKMMVKKSNQTTYATLPLLKDNKMTQDSCKKEVVLSK